MRVRSYDSSDWDAILSWWEASGEAPPIKGMYHSTTSYVVEHEGKAVAALCVYETKIGWLAYVEHFVANLYVPRRLRRDCIAVLAEEVAARMSMKGVRTVVALSMRDKLSERYEELGFMKTADGLSSFVRFL